MTPTTPEPTRTASATALDLPAIAVVDANCRARPVMEAALLRRFGGDYRILTADSETAGLGLLERLGRDGDRVALIAADLGLPGTDGSPSWSGHMASTRGRAVVLAP